MVLLQNCCTALGSEGELLEEVLDEAGASAFLEEVSAVVVVAADFAGGMGTEDSLRDVHTPALGIAGTEVVVGVVAG